MRASKLAQDLLTQWPAKSGQPYAGKLDGTPAVAGHDSLAAADHTGGDFSPPIALRMLSAGEPEGETPLPTTLPHRPRAAVKRSLKRIVFDVLFNGAMLVSALILTFIVLVREEQYAFGQQETPAQAIEQAAQQGMLDTTGESQIIPPSN
jgi:hypothetical protein